MAQSPRSTDADLSDLIDTEAPADGGVAVDTPAYATAADADAQPPVHPDDLIDVEAPPPSAPASVTPAPTSRDVVDRAADALLRLAAERPWAEISLRDVAAEAGVGFAALYARAPGKAALLTRLGTRLDAEALTAIEAENAPGARDRLFEALMSRLEVMAPHRDALLAIGRAQGAALAPALPRTARALLEGSGIDTGGWSGALRLAAVTAVWARTLQVWRDDEGAYNRTMAEIDRRLAQADDRLKRVGAGF